MVRRKDVVEFAETKTDEEGWSGCSKKKEIMEQCIISKKDYNVEYIRNDGYSRFMPTDSFLYKKGLELMAENFNSNSPKQYLSEYDEIAQAVLGYPISDKIKSVRMVVKKDDNGMSYTEIIFTPYPHTIQFTESVKDFLENIYLETEFINGWGDGFFDYPIEISNIECLSVQLSDC